MKSSKGAQLWRSSNSSVLDTAIGQGNQDSCAVSTAQFPYRVEAFSTQFPDEETGGDDWDLADFGNIWYWGV